MHLKRETRIHIHQAISQWQEHIKENKIYAESTTKGYLSSANTLKATLPNLYMKDFTADTLEIFFNIELPSGNNRKNKAYKTKARENLRSVLKLVYEFFCKKRLLRSSPFFYGIKLVDKDDSKFIMPYTDEEVLAICNLADGSGIVEAFAFAIQEGTRVSETLGLSDLTFINSYENKQYADINKSLMFGKIKIPKTNKSKRRIYITEYSSMLIRLMQAKKIRNEFSYILDDKKIVDKFIFVDPSTNKPWQNSKNYYNSLKHYFELAGVQFRGLQPARHTFITNAHQVMNLSFVEIAEIIGHGDPDLLKEHYLHWTNYIRGKRSIDRRNRCSLLTHNLTMQLAA